jgi:hypothetical protein
VLFANGTLYAATTTDTVGSAGAILKLDLGTGGVLPLEFTTTVRDILVDQSFELAWNAPDALSCDKFSSWNEAVAETDPEHITPTAGSKVLAPGPGVYTYGLSCTFASDVVRNMLVGIVVKPRPLDPVDGGEIIGGGEISWLLLAMLVALLSVKIFKETRSS